MELTAEEKQRIEEEECRRVSEEEYRAEVRAKFQGKPTHRRSSVPWLLGVVLVLVIGTLIAWSISSSNHANAKSAVAAKSVARPVPVLKTRYVPVGQNIARGQITVGARGFAQYQFSISRNMFQPVFAGDFTVSGGGGNDIMAVIADEDNYANWINGHQARVFWATQGRETTGQFEVRLPPGTYYLAFSNKFSLFAPKQVSVTAYLNYQKAESYYDYPTAPGNQVNRVNIPDTSAAPPLSQ
jgi:hypothetical protein